MLFKNIVSILIPGALALLGSYILKYYTKAVMLNTGYMLCTCSAVFFILNVVYAVNVHSKAFTELLMAGLVIKLLLALSVVAVCSFISHATLFNFSMHLMLYYILFTIFE